MEAIKDLGERIKTERIAQGYSVKTAAEKSGIARDTWRKIEAGGSVHDTKRHVAMQLLGLSEANAEWGTVGSIEDHAADPAGMIDLNLMFSQAVRFAATVGVMVPAVREEAERVTVALSDLFAHGLELWDRRSPMDRDDDDDIDDIDFEQKGGGDEHADNTGRSAASQVPEVGPADQPTKQDHELIADEDVHDIEDEQNDESP